MEIKDLLGEKYHEGMSDEEVKTALRSVLGVDSSSDSELSKLKKLLSDRNSEVSKLKKDLKDHLTDEEARKVTEKEERDQLVNENKALKEQVAVSSNKAMLLGLGYSDKLAEETAKAMYSGDTEKVLANQKSFLEEHDKAVLADYMKKTPAPGSGGGSPEGMTLEKLKALPLNERVKFSVDHPEEYKELYKGE